jgi:hypothetical protein
MVDADVALDLRHRPVNLQAIEIEVTVVDVKCVRAILLEVPDFLHAEDQTVEPRETTIVFSANGHMSDCWHNFLLLDWAIEFSGYSTTLRPLMPAPLEA